MTTQRRTVARAACLTCAQHAIEIVYTFLRHIARYALIPNGVSACINDLRVKIRAGDCIHGSPPQGELMQATGHGHERIGRDPLAALELGGEGLL